MSRTLVTGGGGFIGSALVRLLIARGDTVVVAGRNRYPDLEAEGARCLVGDIADDTFTDRICADVDTVFHTAAKAGVWGAWSHYFRTNLTGTRNIVASCRRHGVSRLVYTSTPSVVFGRADLEGGDETLPYATSPLCGYAASKIAAERHVLENNDEYLQTCAIRPHLVWGPGDPHLVPRLIERGRRRKLKIVGAGTNRVDITFVDNVARAHVLAATSLETDGKAAGKPYFIGQERPVCLWGWVNDLYDRLGIERVTGKVPFILAYLAGFACETGYRLARAQKEPPMTRFVALQLARSHYFSHRSAERDFGYEPVVGIEEGLERLVAALKR